MKVLVTYSDGDYTLWSYRRNDTGNSRYEAPDTETRAVHVPEHFVRHYAHVIAAREALNFTLSLLETRGQEEVTE